MTLSSAVPVLHSGDYDTSRAFWTQTLDFEIAEEGGNPARFGIFVREGARVFVTAWHGPNVAPHGAWSVYFHTDDAAGVAEALRAKGYPFEGPTDTVYGMIEVTLRDPDGHKLCFGQAVA